MIPCNKYLAAKAEWQKRYSALENKMKQAEQKNEFDKSEKIGEAILYMEQNSGFKKCYNCKKKGCDASFDGFITEN